MRQRQVVSVSTTVVPGRVICVCVLCLAGIAIGHAYYFLEDVFPSKPGGFRILRTPAIM